MATLKIQDSFTLDAPPEEVWPLLLDPRQMADCLPGASLDEIDGDTVHGRVKVSVGPVSVAYKGSMRFVEIDEEARRARMSAKGSEKSGGGSASMELESRVTGTEGGGSEVSLDADVQVVGRIARFGRGMIETVSRQMLGKFTDRLQAKLAGEELRGDDAVRPVSMIGDSIRRRLTGSEDADEE